MPIIRVELLEGRTREQKQAFAKAVTDSFVATCGGTPQSVQVVFQSVAPDDWAASGQLLSEKAAAPSPKQPA